MRKRKEIQEFKVFEDTRTVKVYNKTVSDKADKEISRYRDVGYKIVLLNREKPKARPSQRIGTKEMKRYLKGNIDKDVYNKLVNKIDKKEKFCYIRQWLKEQLIDVAKRTNKKYIPANAIIQVAMANEEITGQINAKQYINDNKLIPPNEEEETTEEEKK